MQNANLRKIIDGKLYSTATAGAEAVFGVPAEVV